MLALTLLWFLAWAIQFYVTDTSAALNTHFLPAFSPHCYGIYHAEAGPLQALPAKVHSEDSHLLRPSWEVLN